MWCGRVRDNFDSIRQIKRDRRRRLLVFSPALQATYVSYLLLEAFRSRTKDPLANVFLGGVIQQVEGARTDCGADASICGDLDVDRPRNLRLPCQPRIAGSKNVLCADPIIRRPCFRLHAETK